MLSVNTIILVITGRSKIGLGTRLNTITLPIVIIGVINLSYTSLLLVTDLDIC